MGSEERSEKRTLPEYSWKRLLRNVSLAVSIPAREPGSVVWVGNIGGFWYKARTEAGITRDQMATLLGISYSSLLLLELGLGYKELGLIQDGKIIPAAALESDLPRRYAEALGQPELYQQFREQFGPHQST